jgi:asparagine synthetase B (glutamine-hydrolysing)
MCGIAGLWSPEPLEGVDQRLRAMIATLRHRRPDGERLWSDGRVGLAVRP